MNVALLASVLTPLVYVLSAVFGAGVGWLLVLFVRGSSRQQQRERELAIARDTARRTFDETIRHIVEK